MCQCKIATVDEAAWPKPWTALQMVQRWNAGQARPRGATESHAAFAARCRRLRAALRARYGRAACPPDAAWLAWLASPEANAAGARALEQMRRQPTPEEFERVMRIARSIARRYRRALLELAKGD
jgi:hypothetical protein